MTGFPINGLNGFNAGGSVPATITKTDNRVSGGVSSPVTYSACSLGTALASRKNVVIVYGGPNTPTVSATLGGNAMTAAHSKNNGNESVHIFYIDNGTTSGTSADVVVTLSISQDRLGISVFAVYDAALGGPAATGDGSGAPATGTLDVPASGVAVGGASQRATSGSYTWTGLTEQVDELTSDGGGLVGSACDAFAAAQSSMTVTADSSVAGIRSEVMACCSWGPAG